MNPLRIRACATPGQNTFRDLHHNITCCRDLYMQGVEVGTGISCCDFGFIETWTPCVCTHYKPPPVSGYFTCMYMRMLCS